MDQADDAYRTFDQRVRPLLWAALVPTVGAADADDAVAAAMEWAWGNWAKLQSTRNPEGYLYRVAQRKARRLRKPERLFPQPPDGALPEVEPGLVDALASLPERQRTVVWLMEACEWTQTEVSTWLGISVSSVRTHHTRALERLRAELEVNVDGPS